MNAPNAKQPHSPQCCDTTFFFAHIVAGVTLLECSKCGTFWRRLPDGGYAKVINEPSLMDTRRYAAHRNGVKVL